MEKTRYENLPLCAVKPEGWYERQLRIQAEGLTGNLPELFKDVSNASAWLGGKGESWERGPYYLDGLLPLAYLLNDEKLLALSQKWIENILNSSRADGFYGPKGNVDYWPRMVVNKILPSYYEATGDERVIHFMDKYYRFMLENIDKTPLLHWAEARYGEELIGIRKLYAITKEEYLERLAEKLCEKGRSWSEIFNDFPYVKPSKDYIRPTAFSIKKVLAYAGFTLRSAFGIPLRGDVKKKTERFNAKPFNAFYHLTHGVNLAMALKYPALSAATAEKGDGGAGEKGYDTLMKYHGLANGLFSGDEHISGSSPTAGVELCSVCEGLFSFETLHLLTGKRKFADLAELLVFSTLPATISPDFKAHQYLQQPNQIRASVKLRKFYDSYARANIFGLKPNYPCCLSNMHQGFPKFVNSAVLRQGDSLVIVTPIPMTVDMKNSLTRISSEYPFENDVVVKCLKGEQKYVIEKPETAVCLKIDGKSNCGETAEFFLKEGESKTISYEYELRVKENADKSVSVYYGNLLLALPIRAEKRTLKSRRGGYDDYELHPVEKWNYAPLLYGGKLSVTGGGRNKKPGYYPFAESGLFFEVEGIEIVDWKEKDGQAGDYGKTLGERKTLKLVPYGGTELRISQFPRISGEK